MFTKERRDGYQFKTKTAGRFSTKLPFYCPRDECRRITDTMDDPYLIQYGVCADCYISCVEDRKKPLIDVDWYRKRLAERGY